MDILSQFTPATVQVVTTTFLLASTVVGQPSDDANVLEQMFCYALRGAALDELLGVSRPPRAQIEDVLRNLGASIPEEYAHAFGQIRDEEFTQWYSVIRGQVDESGADLPEFAEGLRVAKQITSAVAALNTARRSQA